MKQAATSYVREQSQANRKTLLEAVWALREFDPPSEEWVGWSPSHRFMLSLMPEHLQWPDPLWGDILF